MTLNQPKASIWGRYDRTYDRYQENFLGLFLVMHKATKPEKIGDILL